MVFLWVPISLHIDILKAYSTLERDTNNLNMFYYNASVFEPATSGFRVNDRLYILFDIPLYAILENIALDVPDD